MKGLNINALEIAGKMPHIYWVNIVFIIQSIHSCKLKKKTNSEIKRGLKMSFVDEVDCI